MLYEQISAYRSWHNNTLISLCSMPAIGLEKPCIRLVNDACGGDVDFLAGDELIGNWLMS
jgi:hypothetical protein